MLLKTTSKHVNLCKREINQLPKSLCGFFVTIATTDYRTTVKVHKMSDRSSDVFIRTTFIREPGSFFIRSTFLKLFFTMWLSVIIKSGLDYKKKHPDWLEKFYFQH